MSKFIRFPIFKLWRCIETLGLSNTNKILQAKNLLWYPTDTKVIRSHIVLHWNQHHQYLTSAEYTCSSPQFRFRKTIQKGEIKTYLDRDIGGSITPFQKHCQQMLSILVSSLLGLQVPLRLSNARSRQQFRCNLCWFYYFCQRKKCLTWLKSMQLSLK